MENNNHMTNEQIFDMLKPKLDLMETGKAVFSYLSGTNGLGRVCYGAPKVEKKNFTIEDMKEAVATAYRSGYGRAIKGRPFNYADIKKKKKIEEPKPIDSTVHNFNVGDKVVYVGSTGEDNVRSSVCFPSLTPAIGSIGVITNIDGRSINGCNCKVQWDKNSGAIAPYCFWTIANTLRKVIDKNPEIGDNVVMIKEHSNKEMIGYWYPPVGYCGKITDEVNDTKQIRVKWEDGALSFDKITTAWWLISSYVVVVE